MLLFISQYRNAYYFFKWNIMLWYEEWFLSIDQCMYSLDMKHLACEFFKVKKNHVDTGFGKCKYI